MLLRYGIVLVYLRISVFVCVNVCLSLFACMSVEICVILCLHDCVCVLHLFLNVFPFTLRG